MIRIPSEIYFAFSNFQCQNVQTMVGGGGSEPSLSVQTFCIHSSLGGEGSRKFGQCPKFRSFFLLMASLRNLREFLCCFCLVMVSFCFFNLLLKLHQCVLCNKHLSLPLNFQLHKSFAETNCRLLKSLVFFFRILVKKIFGASGNQ